MKSGLMLFKPGTSDRVKRRRLIFLAVWIWTAAMVLWPVYPQFSGIEPLILGLPFGFVWVISAILIGFFGLLWLFFGEED